jgi:DNA topoisomerase-1
MTAELEREMDSISVNELQRRTVVEESQKMLGQAHKQLADNADEIKRIILDALREDTTLGTCSNCGGELRVMRGKTTGKRFVACWGKEGEEAKVPEGAPPGTKPRRGCGQTFPLPQYGAIIPTGTTCPECGWPQIKVLKSGGRGRPWTLCLDPDCPTKEKYSKAKR